MRSREWPLIALVATCALAGVGLADQGLLSDAELGAWDRARAAHGAALDGLTRMPWLPERLRAASFGAFGPELGLRLPGLLATGVSAACVTWIALRVFGSRALAAIASLFYLAFVSVGQQANFAVGAPVLEACVAMTLASACFAGDGSFARAYRYLAALVGALALLGAVASGGIVLGGALPLFVLALGGPIGLPPRMRSAAMLGGCAALSIGVWLGHGQGDGYIPLLAAAKDPALIDNPLRRHLTAAIESFGREVYPFAAPLVLGMVVGRGASWPARWIACGLITAVSWSAFYGPSSVGLTVPAALVCAAFVGALLDAGRNVTLRRAALLFCVGGIWVAAKDAERKPSRVASPHHRYTREAQFPAAEIGADRNLERLASLAWIGLVLAYAAAHGSPSTPRREPSTPPIDEGRPLAPQVSPPRPALAVVGVVLLHQAWIAQRELPSHTAAQLSLRDLFERHQAAVERGALPSTLALHRIRDRGLELYGPAPEDRHGGSTRNALRDWLTQDGERVALIRDSDFPGLYQMHREQGWPFFLLDDAHHDFKLVANFAAPGFEARDPLAEFVLDEAPKLEHETLVRFDQHLEVIGWEIEGDIRRGGEVTVTLALKVLRPLSAGSEIYVRFQQGRMSKINLEPHKPVGGLYPANYWRRGDYILDRVTFEIPRINTVPGPHDLFVGVRRNKKKNLEITVPEGRSGEFGVTLRGRKTRDFANIGRFDL